MMETTKKLKKSVRIRQRKEQEKNAPGSNASKAVLADCPTSPRKMRLVIDLIRGQKVEHALHLLKYNPKEAARRVEKLLLSALANWQAQHEGADLEQSELYIKEAFVDGGRMLKRLRPAPQGRGHRIRKRSNHVTLVIDSASGVTDSAAGEKKEEEETQNN